MKILHPFNIIVYCDKETFTASSDMSCCDVQGLTADNAIKNYLDELDGELNWLTKNESTLSPVLLERLAFLRQYIATD